MILQISDDESIILKNLIWTNYKKGQYKTVDLYLRLENGHLYIVPNNGGTLKIKVFNRIKGKLLKEAREASYKRKPKELEGLCIDLNLQEEPKKEGK